VQAQRLTGYCCIGDMCACVLRVCVQVRALATLIERGTDLKAVDLTGFCYVLHFAQDHCQRLFASSELKSLAAHADWTSSSISIESRSTSYNAGHNWLNLIEDAKKTNPQFAQLWREHKTMCKLSPLKLSLYSGDAARVFLTLARRVCKALITGYTTPGTATNTSEREREIDELSPSIMLSLQRNLQNSFISAFFLGDQWEMDHIQPGKHIPQSIRINLYHFWHLKKQHGTKEELKKKDLESQQALAKKQTVKIFRHIILLEMLCVNVSPSPALMRSLRSL